MIWHSHRCGRLKSMSDTFQLFRFWFSRGCKHWRLKTWQLFLNRLCSDPDLYVISVLSDNLAHHVFPVRGSGLSQMTWRGLRPCHGSGISGRQRRVCRGCGGEDEGALLSWRIVAEWCSESAVSLLGSSRSAQWRVNLQGRPKEPIRRCSSVTYWRGSSASAWFNGAILFVIQPWIDTLDGYQFLDALTLNVTPGFDSVWSICHYLTTGDRKESTERPMWLLLSLFIPSVCIYVTSGGVKNISNHHKSFVPLLLFYFPFPRTAKPESPVMVAVQSAEAY